MFPTVEPNTANSVRLRMLCSRNGGNRVTPNLERSFQCYSKPTSAVLHFERGRTLGHNLNRLPSPCLRRDLSESILQGGNHPENPFRHLNKTYSHSLHATQDADEIERVKRMSIARDVLEFDTALRRETLMAQQMEDQASLRRATIVGPETSGLLHATSASTDGGASPLPPPATPTPGMGSKRGSVVLSSRQSQRRSSSRGGTGTTPMGSRQGPRASTSMTGSNAKLLAMSQREREKHVLLHGVTPEEFSLKSHADYHSPFDLGDDPFDLNGGNCSRVEVNDFDEKQRSPDELERRAALQLATANVTPPKLIVMMFKFGNVRTLAVTDKLRHIGYPTLHEQFSTTSERGCVTRQQFIQVLIQYMPMREVLEALKILSCFDRTAIGDVDLNIFLLGLQILLRCATAGDALRYCFTLMDTNSRIPRYVTRFEIQTLVDCAASLEQPDTNDEVQKDVEYELMSRAIKEVLVEAWRYDYLGRIALKAFLDTLQEKVHLYKGATRKSAFVLETVWEGTGAVAAVHRMSSRNLLLRSLTPQVNPKDPHAIPLPLM